MDVVRVSPPSILGLALTAYSGQVWAQPGRPDYHGPWMMWDGGWMFFGPIMMLAFMAAIVVVVVLLFRWVGGHRGHEGVASESRAMDILKERFARGEIDKEEYEERRQALRE